MDPDFGLGSAPADLQPGPLPKAAELPAFSFSPEACHAEHWSAGKIQVLFQ